jgi:cell division protein ZapA
LRRSIAVQIAGQSYALKSDADEAYVQFLAGFVDEKIREVQRKSKQIATQKVAILAALQIADDLFRERRRRSELRQRVREQARKLLDEMSARGGKPETK